MVLLYIGNTEWIRIPAFQLGFGLLGMVRRTREHDGEYQRGRIMGYLVANPGVHFRALLGALDMSNGQLTHHLKNLEGDERIWRRKDGRLVRFYPAAIQQSLSDDDLPVPLLTPDPNSLQGKILQLLDATENDIINLSQKELSIRLEASQQLISHHLRTLEKFGLIEREKVGMRYRYQLTREAIFLINSNDFNVDTD
jgi:predicted transcriptional regulator